MSFPVPQSQLFAFEENIEAFLVAYLLGSIARVGRTRSGQDFLAPYVGVTFYNGAPILENQHSIPGMQGRGLPFNSYTGRILTSVATIRKDDPTGSVHTGLLAIVRTLMQVYNLNAAQSSDQIDFIADCREGDSIGTYDDEKDIDYTEITWNIWHSLNPLAWPSNFDTVISDSNNVVVSDSNNVVVSATV